REPTDSTLDSHEAGLRLTGALRHFWETHGHFAEGRFWIDQVLRHTKSAPYKLRFDVLSAAGALGWHQGDYALSRHYHEQSLALARQADHRVGVAVALGNLGLVSWHEGDLALACSRFEESLAMSREIGDTRKVATSLHNLGILARLRGDLPEARTLCEECI